MIVIDSDQLMDHREERRQNSEVWKMVQHEVVDAVKELVADDIDDELIHRMIGILNINSVSFTGARDGVTGRALYPLLAVVNHSCVANSRFAGKMLCRCK